MYPVLAEKLNQGNSSINLGYFLTVLGPILYISVICLSFFHTVGARNEKQFQSRSCSLSYRILQYKPSQMSIKHHKVGHKLFVLSVVPFMMILSKTMKELIIRIHTTDGLQRFTSYLNSQHPNMKFAPSHSPKSIPFLNVKVSLDDSKCYPYLFMALNGRFHVMFLFTYDGHVLQLGHSIFEFSNQ